MRLFIAEKPGMGMDIAKALNGTIQRGNGYVTVGDDIVTWAVGHLIGQAPPEAYDPKLAEWGNLDPLPFFPGAEWKMEANPKTKQQLKVVGTLLRQADLVVNCGDAAREGQMIVDELLDYFHYRGPAKRLWLQAMNTNAIRQALARMVDNRQMRNLYNSALARSRADYYIGLNLTRAYTSAWRSKGYSDVIHVGRVQTTLLCLLVARDLAIESFVPVSYYVLGAEFKHANGTFVASWIAPDDAPYLDDDGHVIDRTVLEKIARDVAGKEALITSYVTKPEKRNPPLTFSLGGLQKACFGVLGLTPAQTLKIAQALYEKHKLTTYPRTDYSHLPEEEHHLGQRFAECAMSNFGAAWDLKANYDYSIKSPAWNSSKIGDHHGIRPTETKNYDLSQLSKIELAVYRLVVRNYMAQFLPPYRFESTSVTVLCDEHQFKTSGVVPVDQGWKVLFQVESESDDDEDAEPRLPAMAAGDGCMVLQAKCEDRKTKPLPRFNHATLLGAMEQAYKYVLDERIKSVISESGIGTPATRAKMIDNLFERDYADEVKEGRKKVIVSSAKGRMVYHGAPLPMRTPDITAYFESLLQAVEQGKLSMDAFLEHQAKFVTKLVQDVKSGAVAAQMADLSAVAPPERKAPTRRKTSEAGPAGNRGARDAATGGGSAPRGQTRNYGKPTPRPGDGEAKKTCPKCSKPMVLRSNGAFWGCTGYPDCRCTEDAGGGAQRATAGAQRRPQENKTAATRAGNDELNF